MCVDGWMDFTRKNSLLLIIYHNKLFYMCSKKVYDISTCTGVISIAPLRRRTEALNDSNRTDLKNQTTVYTSSRLPSRHVAERKMGCSVPGLTADRKTLLPESAVPLYAVC